MKKHRPNMAPKPMLEALQALQCDSRLKSQAYHFLKSDLTKLNSEADFAQAYTGLLAAQQLLGPMGDDYRQALKEMHRIPDVSIHHRLLPARDYDRRLDDLAAAWLEVCEMFRAHLPVEVWEKVGQRTEAVFSKARLREGLRS